MNKSLQALACVAFLCTAGASAWADEGKEGGLAKMLPAAKVTLQQGLTASEAHGKPISGKFEIDEGHFQLSVYTAQGGKFYEVIVDHNTGKVAKTEAITEGEDLTEAKSQSAAAAKAKKSLKAAVDQAEHEASGFRAVSVTPRLDSGHPVAVVTLMKGAERKSVSQSLE